MFNLRLREQRMLHGLTQQALSDQVGIALRSYQCYEQGTREPSFALLVALADVLETSIDYLMGRDEFLRSLGVSVDVFQASPQEHPR